MMRSIFHPYSTKDYRQDIQGIRALGALLIMVYHLWLGKVSGGVDIFFVISGYFMATAILSRLARDGRIVPMDFWGNIIKRIAPSAYTVLLVTLFFSYFFIPETQWVRLVDETIASAMHLENVLLMQTSVDYFASDEPASAVQQFWALSIQMQFYLLLPVAFLVGAALAQWRKSLDPLIFLFGSMAAASFIYSLIATAESPASAYFNPLTRSWEFFCGVLSALLIPLAKLAPRVRHILSYVGLAGVFLTGLVIPQTAPFPGYVAAMPVLAAVFLLVSNPQSLANPVGRFLMHPIFAFLGSISFTIYLWHWPLLIFYKEASGATDIGILAGLGIIGLAIVLAYLTTRYIETPLRSQSGTRTRDSHPTLSAFVLGAQFAAPAVLIPLTLKLFLFFMIKDYRADHNLQFEGTEVGIQKDARTVTYQQFLFAKRLLPQAYMEGCNQNPASPEVIACDYGDTTASRIIALVGGSHALQWLPALDAIGKMEGYKVVNITKSLCPFGPLETSDPSCKEWNKNVIDHLIKTKPTVVVTTSTRAANNGKAEYVPQSYVDQWKILEELEIPKIGIRDNPRFPFDPADCLARNKLDSLSCSTSRSKLFLANNPAQLIAEDFDIIKVVDMTDFLCTSETCVTVHNDLVMYGDDEHISVTYSVYLATALHKKFAEVMPHIFGGDPQNAIR
jgi:peptidoglycan/LPS O-acetylase OafA/YrhL